MESVGRGFISGEHVPEGSDEYYLRNRQTPRPDDHWRHLKAEEIEILVRNNNTASAWGSILVSDQFVPHHVKNCEFYGLVRIGKLEDACLEFHEMMLPIGITDSRIISCDIGDGVAIHNVRHLAHYIVGDNVILLNIGEMHTSNHAKFGNGIVKNGEDEEVRLWLDLVNENGGRAVMPFDGMLAADAYLWAKHRGDGKLMARLAQITQKQFDPRRGFYGMVGPGAVIKNCRIIKDVNVGPSAYIKGANKLKNLTINSSDEEPTQIGEGVELVNGIIGFGCHAFYGCKAVRFVMGDHSSIKYGARLIHSYLGDNSTISCCEVLNDLIFPAHEQHHNNSFLIAALVKGQSNMAACATIGSNHNSRSPDGEIEAGRGFWPGLSTSVKHFCRFASFALLAKGDYPHEMDIPLPFSLISNDPSADRLLVMPAYWWTYNMYALARNSWKFGARDTRLTARQHIEFDALAPDTAEEMFSAMFLLEVWTGKACLRAGGEPADGREEPELARIGHEALSGPREKMPDIAILADFVEHSGRDVVILKAHEGYRAYRQMLHYYAARNLLAYLQDNPAAGFGDMRSALQGERERNWVNFGGQLIAGPDAAKLREDIARGELECWNAIHGRYDELWERYRRDKQRHAYATLDVLTGGLTEERWAAALNQAVEIQRYVAEETFRSRKKDFDNPFRRITFDNEAENLAVMGSAEDNSFVAQVRKETAAFEELVAKVKGTL